MKVKNKIFSLGIIFLVMFVFLALNFSAILSFYQSLENREKTIFPGRTYLNVSEYDKFILFEDLLGTTNYLADYSEKEKRDICYFNTDYQTRKSMQYIFSHYFPKTKNVLGRSGNKDWDCDFFVLAQKKKGEDGIKELGEKYKVINREKDFGNMTLWKVDYLGEKGDVKVQIEEKGLSPKAEVIGDLWK